MKQWKQLMGAILLAALVSQPVYAQLSPIDVKNKQVCLSSARVSAEFPKWSEFGDGCLDYCGAHDSCTAAIEYGCDCGPKHCWNYKTQKCEKE